MTGAALQAGLAGTLLAVGVVELLAAAPTPGNRGGRAGRLARRVRGLAPPALQTDAIRRRVAAAGLADQFTVADLLGLKCALAIGAVAVVFVGALAAGQQSGALVSASPAAAMFFAVDLVLLRRAQARRRRLELEIPGVLDLLAVTVQAGLPTTTALDAVARRHQGLLGRELARACDEIALGALRRDALATLVERCPHPGVAAMAAAVARSDLHGTPLAPALSAIAADARQLRARALREHAAKAAPKVQLVIALGLVPATMLLVAAGLIRALG
ncbi:MAG TPA: type II secretion system F family protein [Baekduia sp.]|nr:type II secretion system F family protein [Baekduia sp.]